MGSGTQNPRARAEARRGARTSPRARASPVPRFVVAFPEAGGSASDAGGKREDGDARVVARRGDGETEGAERGTRDEPWSRARSAPGLARARALRRRHSALLVTRERARFLSGEKEEGRRSVGGFRMTRFAGSPTREKGRGRTLVFGDAVMFLETPPMVAFDAAFALAAAPPRRRCDVQKADSSPPALPRRESFGEDEPSTRCGSFVFPRK